MFRYGFVAGACAVVVSWLCAASGFAASAPVVGVGSEFAGDVSSSSVTLGGEVDPGGMATSYSFEYGTVDCSVTPASCKSVPAPAAALGEGEALLGVSVHVQGLAPQTTYHYRLVAENTEGVATGPDLTFTTQPAGGEFALPDARAWELVSPPDKDGSGIYALEAEDGVIQAAEDGDGIAYIAAGPIPGGGQPAGNHAFAPTQILSKRLAGGGWGTQDVQTPRNPAIGHGISSGTSAEYVAFSSDLSLGLLEPRAGDPPPPLKEEAEESVYLRHESGAYEALVTAENVFEGAKSRFGAQTGRGGEGVIALTGTPDLSHVVLKSVEVALVEGAGGGGLYEWTAGRPASEPLELISVLPGGDVTPDAFLGRANTLLRHAISDDGERVIFSVGPEPGSEKVFLRDNALQSQSPLADGGAAGEGTLTSGSDEVTGVTATSGAFQAGQTITSAAVFDESGIPAGTTITKQEGSTLTLSAAATRTGSVFLEAFSRCTVPADACTVQVSPGRASYQTASSDGSRVFYTEGGELYVFTAPIEEGSAPSTVDLTEGVGVQGDVIGASENGEYAYLVTAGALSESENAEETVAGAENENARGQKPEGDANLYVIHYEHEKWKPTFIANLSEADTPDWDEGSAISENGADLTGLTARVSPDGQRLAFMSQERITGYDNTDLASGAADEEVYEYDAQSNRTVCASCNPTGGRPTGIFDPIRGAPVTLLVDRPHAWETHWLAASIPGWTAQDLETALYQSRYLDDDGRLFFNSPDALVPADVNAKENVYEYDPEGLGGCSSETENPAEVYSPEANGCIGLISSGTSSEDSAFLDASAAGPGGQEAEDVFFITSSRLAPRDTDSAYDVYDAHICSTQVPCPPTALTAPPACNTTDSCRAAPTPQPEVFGEPSSQTFSGNGNLLPAPTPAAVAVKPKPLGGRALNRLKLAAALKACQAKRGKKRAGCEAAARRKYGKAKKGKKTK